MGEPKQNYKRLTLMAWLAIKPEDRPITHDEPTTKEEWDTISETERRGWEALEAYTERGRIEWENKQHWEYERENESREDRAHDRLSLERDVFLSAKSKKKKKK